jgi:hypothetical protein
LTTTERVRWPSGGLMKILLEYYLKMIQWSSYFVSKFGAILLTSNLMLSDSHTFDRYSMVKEA